MCPLVTNGIGDGTEEEEEEEVEEEKLNDDSDDGEDDDAGTGGGDAEEDGSGDIVAVWIVVDVVAVFVVSSNSVFATMLWSNRMAACTKT